MKKIVINADLIKIIVSGILFLVAILLQNEIAKLVLFITALVIVGYEILFNAIKNIFKGEVFNENLLMIIASAGAFLIGEYPEAVAVMLLYQVGEYLSDLAVDKSKNSITKLLDLRCEFGNVYINGKTITKKIEDICVGDILIIKPGERVPLDSIIIEGNGYVDTSSLTGESVPKFVEKDDAVLSGYLNTSSLLKVKVTNNYATSTASKIIEALENSNDKKTKTEKFITRFCKIYTPVVVGLALVIAFVPWLIFGQDFSTWIYRALEFLVISCPCALVISIPLAFFCGIGRASHEGILIKGSNELDHLSKVSAMIFDKTGTLTNGKLTLEKICPIDKIKESYILKLSAYAESFSTHPIAKALLEAYNKKIDQTKIENYKEFAGSGVSATINGKHVLIGSGKFLKNYGIEIVEHKNEIGTTIYVAEDNKYIGHILIADTIKDEAYTLATNLAKLGITKLVILSGDDVKIVEKVGKELNIKDWHGNLLPNQKIQKVEELKKQFFTAFVGDGLNDTPAIKLSDVGIAMGKMGSDSTIDASDIVLIKDDLNNLPKAIKISRLTKKVILTNIIFALSFKFVCMVLSFFGLLPIWLAVFADVGVTMLTVLNSFVIFKLKI